uniref:Ig-like domain-containing protein n=1 Tax=Ideonella sp. TaxID=1929293 RepID=UPI0037BE9C30
MSAQNTPATTAAPANAQRVLPQVAAAAAEAAASANPAVTVAGQTGLAAAVLPGGQVLAVEGSAWLQVPGQAPQPLSAGAAVPPGAVMLAAADAVVRLSRPQSVGAKAAAKGGLDKLIADFDKGVGDTATAAGVAGGDETTAEGGLRVDRISEATTTAGLGTNGSGTGSTGAEFPTAGTAGGTPDGTTPTTPPNIVLDNPGLTGDATPRISGSTDLAPGSLVTVTVTDTNGQVQVITATVGSDGRFAVDTAPLPDGNFSVNVQAENTTVTTGGTVDTTPPTLRLDPVAITGDNTPAISGQSNLPSGSTVKVTVVDAAGKSQELTATIGSDGRFSVSPGQNLSDGRYTVQVVATDAAGNAQTNTTTGVVDTKAPAVSVDAPDLSNSTQPTVSGRTDLPSGTPIEVKITDANGQTQTAQATVRPDGGFSLKPSSPLPDGPFKVEVTGRDAAGNPSTSTSTGTVDSTAPLSPSIGSVLDDHGPIQGKLNPGGATDDSRPTFNGTAEPGSTVTIYTNGVPIGTAPVAPNGTWSFTPEVPLPAGPNSITTTATDPAGNTGPSSQPFALTVDVGAPQVPSIISATDNVTPVEGLLTKGSGTNDNTPTLNGYGRPGETVTLFADGQAVGSVVVNAKGEWSITPGALADKTWNFTAEAVNIHGVQSPVTGAWPLTIDTQAPRQVAVDTVTDNAGPVRGEITEGSTTDDATPTWQGQGAEPGSTITVYDKGVALGSTTVGPDGTWRFTPPVALPDGPHSLTITATDAVGNVSPATPPLNFSIDTSQVSSPTIDSVTEAGATGEVPMAFNQASKDTTPTLSGSSKPNQVVQVYDGETLLGETQANASGQWSFTPSTPLPDGPHDFVAVSLNAAGVPSEPSNTFRVVVDTVAPDAPPSLLISDDVGRVQGSLQSGDSTDDNTPTFSGSGANPGDTITVLDGGQPVGTAVVKPNGTWSLTPLTPLTPGAHEFTLTATDPAGNTSAPSAPFALTIDIAPPDAPTIGGIFDNTGAVVGEIAPGATTDDAKPTIWGSAEPGSTVEVFDGDTLLGRATTGPDGYWTFTPTLPLLLGEHEISARAVDEAGNTSAPSAPRDFNLMDDAPPSAPAIVNVIDDQGTVQGNVAKSTGITDDTQPSIRGTAEPGAVITVRDGSNVLGTATTDSSGRWAFTPATPLADGPHAITVTATNAAGNVSAPTGIYDFVVDTQNPDAPNSVIALDNVGPVVGAISNGQTTDDATPGLSGTGEPGATVTIYDHEEPIGTTVVKPDGTWQFTPTTPLLDGEHSLSTTQTDVAGNTGPASAPTNFTLDTKDVTTPTITALRDDVGTVQGAVQPDGVTDDTRPTLQGTAPAGTTVNVYDGTTLLGTVPADSAGRWSFTPSTPLADGPHAFSATATNAAGVVSPATAPYAVTVDTQGPAAPAITGLGDDVGTVQGALTDGARTDDTTPTLSGTGEPGSTIKVYDGAELIGTATVDPDGRWTLTPATPLTEGPHTFTATATDPAGNTGPASPVQSLVVDLTATAAPTLTIAEDANDNGVVNLAELSGKVDITIGLPAGARVGDVLNLSTTTGNQTLTISAEQLAAGRVLAQVDAPASGEALIARVTLTDEAGNTSASAGDAAEFDYETPDASTTALVINPITADNIVNAAEAGQTLQVTGQALGEFSTGDTVTLSINGKSFSGIVAQDGSFSIAVPGADLAADPDHSVAGSLRATDPAGNQADIGAMRVFSVDTAATGAPTVTLVEDANNDGFINRAELNGLVITRVDLPQGAAVGDRVDVSNGEVTNSIVLTAQDLSAGHVLTGFVAPPTGSIVAITATLTDVAGNTSPQGSDSARVDTSGPSSATTGISINPLTADNVINAAEAGSTVNVTGQATGEFKPGDVVTLSANGKTFTGTLGADGSFTVAVPGADLAADGDKTLDVSIRITDPAGNQANITATRPYGVDTTATGTPTVTIAEDANDNGFISRAELNGVIDVRVDLPAGTVAGDTLSVSNGSTTSTFTITAEQAAAGFINTSFAAPAEGQLVQVTAILTDIAGNASPQGSDAARIDTTGPSGGPGGTTGLVLDSLSADNVINAAEAGGSVRVTGHATGEFTAGDTVTLDINGQSFSGQVAADGSFSIPVPGAELAVDPDKTVQASLRATDATGNQTDIPASRAYGVDISATGAPTVAIAEDANNNGFISRAELNGVVDVRVGLPAGTVAGDTLTVSNGSSTASFVVTAAQLAAGHIDTSFAAPADGQMVNVTAILTDIAGNASPQGTDAARIDTTGPSSATTGITVNPVSADNIVNAAEAAGPVNVTGRATGEFTPGDVVTITANGKPFTGTLGADGSFTVAVPGADLVADGDKTLDVSIRITDPAGNQADIPATRAYSVDTAATGAPTVTIAEDANNNGFISRAELNGVVDVRVGLPAGTVAGDTLTVSNGTATTPITVTAAHLAAGFVDTSFAAPADGQTVDITAILTDIAGNASPQGTDAARIDTTGPSSATTGITVNPVSADNIVNAAEAAGPVNVTGRATGEFTPGDVVTITANGKPYTGTLGADGSFTVAVPGADLVADGDKTLDVSIRITDPAGNQADIPATRAYSVDTAATGAPTVTISEDANNNGFISRAELNGVVDVRVGLPAGTVAGDTLTVSNG